MEQVRVKQEPGTDDSYSCPSSSMKTERGKDGRSACMVGVLHLYYVLSVRRTSFRDFVALGLMLISLLPS